MRVLATCASCCQLGFHSDYRTHSVTMDRESDGRSVESGIMMFLGNHRVLNPAARQYAHDRVRTHLLCPAAWFFPAAW
ncbi:hypothetical protein CesoFtcFv8_013309 [Champsocephalus esox]|uniref:Uncharacterized protein n=1 Tax=Champsocephalus esox TaxID=159716 RepID=A0AAN8GUS4_9TELE|nr:hypothetical protein CesoFtcFv8_013309 [Champsocephalus esox]